LQNLLNQSFEVKAVSINAAGVQMPPAKASVAVRAPSTWPALLAAA
jgi:hypothetical protein